MGQSLSRLLIHDSIQTLIPRCLGGHPGTGGLRGSEMTSWTKGRELEGPPIQQQEKGEREDQADVVVEEIL